MLKNRLQEVMWLKHMSQEDLSKITGIKQSYLSEIITGQRNIQIPTAQKLAKALGKSMDYLWPY